MHGWHVYLALLTVSAKPNPFKCRRKGAACGMRTRSPFSRGLLIAKDRHDTVTVWCLSLAFILLVIVLALDTPPPSPETLTVKKTPLPLQRRVGFPTTVSPVFDSEVSYYRTIIKNNLFRPLGWRPPRPREPYRLLGTILAHPHDGDTPPKAIIQTTAGETTHIVTTGDKLDADTEVVSIEAKQVTLQTNGQQRSLSLNADLWIQ